MNRTHIRFVDDSGGTVATAEVVDEGTYFGGTIDLTQTAPEVRALFAEFEEVVSGQMFSFLDELQDRMEAICTRAEFDDGREVAVHDLQVYPETGDVSFRVRGQIAPTHCNGTEHSASALPGPAAAHDTPS